MLTKIRYFLPYNLRRCLYAVFKRRLYLQLQQKKIIDTNRGYSYKPFIQNKCIFVHIPKAAGVSVCQTLFHNLAGGHQTIAKYQIVFSKKEFNSYFKFTFVRNPWDRIFSAYNFLKNGGLNAADNRWAKMNLAKYNCFEDFVKRWVNSNNIYKYVHFVPQYHFLCHPGNDKLLVDFVGYYENIEEDFDLISNKLASPPNSPLKYENKTHIFNKKLEYKSFYTDETRNIVYEVYRKDIELFGYNFDNSLLKTTLAQRTFI